MLSDDVTTSERSRECKQDDKRRDALLDKGALKRDTLGW
eukprot:COSAG04_NODE_431_length_14522_cov_23.420717_9_plen_39_part_00